MIFVSVARVLWTNLRTCLALPCYSSARSYSAARCCRLPPCPGLLGKAFTPTWLLLAYYVRGYLSAIYTKDRPTDRPRRLIPCGWICKRPCLPQEQHLTDCLCLLPCPAATVLLLLLLLYSTLGTFFLTLPEADLGSQQSLSFVLFIPSHKQISLLNCCSRSDTTKAPRRATGPPRPVFLLLRMGTRTRIDEIRARGLRVRVYYCWLAGLAYGLM